MPAAAGSPSSEDAEMEFPAAADCPSEIVVLLILNTGSAGWTASIEDWMTGDQLVFSWAEDGTPNLKEARKSPENYTEYNSSPRIWKGVSATW